MIYNSAKRTKRVGASSRVRGRELSYGVHSIRLHHPTSGLNSPPFSVARVFCISLQYFHLSALPLTVPLQKAALVSAYSVTGKPLLFVSLFHRRCKQRKALCIRGLKHFLPTLFVHPSSCFKEDETPATLDSTSVAGVSTNSFCPITLQFRIAQNRPCQRLPSAVSNRLFR